MYIKEIAIDGFKSYAHRTVIGPYDRQFNAITGLNGSGKSNILDAICFVLGITNLSHVRATNLQELVYKNGQAGVTKASVSITFDNSDKSQSPLGYEHYNEIVVTRQVVVGGRNKYLINGSNAPNNRVNDLFRSVQLNVNNPHFLIMQGRITKVLNMKPPEILAMLEEAAGTRLYESKRETAVKTIERKDAKLKEINEVLNDEITPKMTKLREERAAYLEYQNITREYEHLSKLHVAWQFVQAQENKAKFEKKIDDKRKEIDAIKQSNGEFDQRIPQIEAEIEELAKKKQEEEGEGSTLKKYEEDLKQRRNLETTASSKLDNKKETLKTKEKSLKEAKKHLAQDNKAVEAKRAELKKLEESLVDIERQGKADEKEREATQKALQALAAGMATDESGQAATLAQQLMRAKQDMSAAQTTSKQCDMKLRHLRDDLKKKDAASKASERDYAEERQLPEALEREINRIQAEIDAMGYEEGSEERLAQQKRQLSRQVTTDQERADVFEARNPQLRFQYKDPIRGFDRSKVKGLVAQLFKMADVKAATALEVAAGGRLYNVVVDTETTGKQLLEHGGLQRRVTIIPLNRIRANVIDNSIVRRAKDLVGANNCDSALTFIGFENEVKTAMEYVFGGTLVCPDMNTAKRVCYDPSILRRTVTFDGESFDPSGTLTGGSRAHKGSLLQDLNQHMELLSLVSERRRELEAVDKQLHDLGNKPTLYRNLKQQLELKNHELGLARRRLEQTSHHQQRAEIEGMKKEIAELEKSMDDAKKAVDDAEERVKELEDRMKNANAWLEKERKTLEKKLADAKKRAETSVKTMEQKQQQVEVLRGEIGDLETSITTAEEEIVAAEAGIQEAQEELATLAELLEEAKAVAKRAQDAVDAVRANVRARNKEMQAKHAEQERLRKQKNNNELKIRQLEADAEKLRLDMDDAGRRVRTLMDSYDWIRADQGDFGVVNGIFDFSKHDMNDVAKRLEKLRETKDKLSRNVNVRAMNMLGRAEEQYDDLIKKKKTVEKDKEKIAAVITDLDEKKKHAIEKAWDRVNKDFGSIFGTLLPRSNAKLQPPAGQTALQGLEVRVAFGGSWKESLSELSGGQRSLVALSLILAMLLFKPAPIYILDEVDAALDLSHTQNIGLLIRSKFKHSQFIVVSLKDGMFNNANVLFRTKLVDGMSTVSRHFQHSASDTSANTDTSAAAGKGENEPNKRRRRNAIANSRDGGE